MWKRLAVVMVAALLIVSALFITKPNTDEGPIKLRLGHITGESDPWHLGALKFAELVKEKTGGEIEVEVYASSMLGNDRDLIEGMQIGSVDFALPAGVLSNFYSPYAILELPYLFRDKQHLENVLYGEVGNELKQSLLDNAEVRGLEFWMRTPRELTANKKIETPNDLRGLKIRVPEIPASIAAWEAMGATPTPMAFGEVYSSLQTGVIDAQENPVAFTASSKIQEVQKYMMMTDHVYGYVMLAMSEVTYQRLNEFQRQAIEEAAKEATEYENQLVFEQEEQIINELKEFGTEFVEVDKGPFEAAAKSVHERFANMYGRELYDKIINTP
ncbi:TRAP transporter substrate-binding protein [Paenibacillus lautus]|uniref:TRAP transporter substrate-binding protein n=1 Tax=Paenibacillus lautus TaxID=1401 RepID=UPI001C7CF360|nr:TRAP transporter substrate-binding protein [Paenibacillus lautus]MBX4146971.1 TRAP transporter substrate-binding protein [Paenibacillus lautus]